MPTAEAEALITRRAPLKSSSWDAEAGTVEAVIAAGAGVRRYDERGAFTEYLSPKPEPVDSVPVLDAHARWSVEDVIGDASRIRAVGEETHALITLSRANPKAQLVRAELDDGRRYGVSIGYRVQEWRETTDQKSGLRSKTATRWTIHEVSLVPIPADPNAGTRSDQPMPNENPATDQVTTTTPPPQQSAESAPVSRAAVNAEIRSIARLSGLPQTFVDQQIDREATADEARKAAFEALQARSASAEQLRPSFQIGADHTDPDQIRSAMADALAHRLAPGAVKLEGRATEYRGHSLLDLVGDMAVARGDRVNLRDREALMSRAVGAHSTSDFPLLVADAANKALLAQYQVAAPTYRTWAARRNFADFKEHSFLRVGDVPAFTEIHENGETKYGTVSENAEKIAAKEYGTGLALGRRLLMNDDLSALSDFTAGIATRAANDENKLAYGVLAANPVLSDGVALFHATHGNLAATGTVIDATSIGAAVKALRAQKSLDGMVLNLQPAYLVVGPAYETAARQILAAVMPTKAADVNVWSGFAELVVDANITGNDWYLFASPSAAPTVIYGYVQGAEGPQIRSERDFDTQALKVAASLDFAVGASDFRGAYRNAGA